MPAARPGCGLAPALPADQQAQNQGEAAAPRRPEGRKGEGSKLGELARP